MRQQLLVAAEVVATGFPNECLLLLFLQIITVRQIGHAREQETLEAKVVEQRCVGVRVTEGVKHPADRRFHSEFFLQELVTNMHVQNHVFVVWTRLISSNPATLGNLQLAILDQLLDDSFVLLVLNAVPHGEELHFDISEKFLRVLR